MPINRNRDVASRNRRRTSKRPAATTVRTLMRADHLSNPRPMPFGTAIHFTKKFRFTNGSGSAGTFNISPCKLCALVCTCTVNSTQATQFFDAVRLISVEIWALGVDGSPTPSTVSVIFNGNAAGLLGNDISYSDTSIGATRVAHVKASPPTQSQTAQWQSGVTNSPGSNLLFSIAIPDFAVVDITAEFSVPSQLRTSLNTVALSGATAVLTGIYYLALDNNAGGGLSVGSALVPTDALLPTTK